MSGDSNYEVTCATLAVTKIQSVLIAVILIAATSPSVYFLLSNVETAPFSLKVVRRPASFGDIVYSIPRQKCLFLVALEEDQIRLSSTLVTLSVTSLDCEVMVFLESMTPGQVAELSVILTQIEVPDCT